MTTTRRPQKKTGGAIDLLRAQRLKKARETAGYLTPTDAARALGVTESTYLSHENGWRNFGVVAGVRYADAFGVSFAWLMVSNKDPHRELRADVRTLFERLPPQRREKILLALKHLLECILDEQDENIDPFDVFDTFNDKAPEADRAPPPKK